MVAHLQNENALQSCQTHRHDKSARTKRVSTKGVSTTRENSGKICQRLLREKREEEAKRFELFIDTPSVEPLWSSSEEVIRK